jgi:transcriptional regulator with XRE-family HTH domain
MVRSLYTAQYAAFLQQLIRARHSRRLRQRDLAERLGRTQSAVSKVERGVQDLNVIELIEWLRALDVDFGKFMIELYARFDNVSALDSQV